MEERVEIRNLQMLVTELKKNILDKDSEINKLHSRIRESEQFKYMIPDLEKKIKGYEEKLKEYEAKAKEMYYQNNHG